MNDTETYEVTRLPEEYIGTFHRFVSIKYNVDEYGEPDNDVHDWPPREGEGTAFRGNMAMCDNCPTSWLTTEIEEIHSLTEDTCTFRTKNSEYKIVKIK